jgi:hypothetical protein
VFDKAVCCAVLCCAVLCCAALCCAVLCCAALCCAQVPAVLMLTNCCEAGMVKCSQYFPHSLGSVSKAGAYQVKVRLGLWGCLWQTGCTELQLGQFTQQLYSSGGWGLGNKPL